MKLVPKREKDKDEVGENICIIRQQRGMTQRQLADMLGISENTVSRHEMGAREMGINYLYQYADALGVDPSALSPKRYKRSNEEKRLCGCKEELIDLLDELDYEALAILLSAGKRFTR